MNSKTKILYLITKSNWGGAQKYVFELATGLPKESFDVQVGVGGDGELKTRLEAAGIRTISIPSLSRDISILGDAKVFFSLLSLLRKERPDIIHVNSSKIGGLGALAGRVAGIRKIIFTGHGWAFNEERSALSKIFIRFLSWVTIVLSHQTIVVSEHMKSQAAGWPLVSNKVSVIHNGIRVPDFYSKEEARHLVSTKVGVEESDAKNVLWVGTISELHKNKGLAYAISAFAELEKNGMDFRFFIIGEGELRQELEQQIRENGLEKKIFLCGHIENAARYLKAFDIFTLTSITEGLAYVVMEAGVASLPVLGSKVGGVPEIISHNGLGILTRVRDSKDISIGLGNLLSDEKLRQSLGAALEQRIREVFSLERMSEQTLALYKL